MGLKTQTLLADNERGKVLSTEWRKKRGFGWKDSYFMASEGDFVGFKAEDANVVWIDLTSDLWPCMVTAGGVTVSGSWLRSLGK